MPTNGRIGIDIFFLCVAVILGSLVSISTDYILSDLNRFNWFIFSNSKYIGLFLGSFSSGIFYRRRGWLAGIIVSLVHIIFIFFLLTNSPSFVSKENAIIEWHLHFHTAIIFISIGFGAGFLGSQLAKATIRRWQ